MRNEKIGEYRTQKVGEAYVAGVTRKEGSSIKGEIGTTG